VYLVTGYLWIFFGSLVDQYQKTAMMLSKHLFSLYTYSPTSFYFSTSVFTDPSSVILWVFIILALVGALAGNLRTIALSTLVTTIPEAKRDKANGLVGTANGVAFSLLPYLRAGNWFLGVFWMLVFNRTDILVIIHLGAVSIPEQGSSILKFKRIALIFAEP